MCYIIRGGGAVGWGAPRRGGGAAHGGWRL